MGGRRKVNRSRVVTVAITLVLAAVGAFTVIPLVFAISNAFKPLDEFFLFPPRLVVMHPTPDNFADLASLLSSAWVPFSRYCFNSLLVVVLGTGGHIGGASQAAYALARHRFPGSGLLFAIVILSLMFAREVTQVPNFFIMSALGLIDTYWATLLPAIVYPLGIFLMKQFMEHIPEALIESARISGATEYQVLWRIVMPMVRPAWLTLLIFNFNYVWGEVSTGNAFIFLE